LCICTKSLVTIFAIGWTEIGLLLWDGDDFIAGRDPMGVKPLYYGLDERGRIYFSKWNLSQITNIFYFPPGHYYTAKQVL
jgi:asparagine synthase (glutamine-hydrolysing)